MLQALVTFSLRFRGVIVALACLIFGYGIYILYHSRYDVYPEFAPPRVVVQTEAPGLAPEEVEALVTHPVESALNGSPNLSSIRSQSTQGLSVVTATFEDKTDIYRDRQMVTERLTEAASRLPVGVQAPTLGPLTSSTSLSLIVGLTSKTRTPMQIRTFADWTLRPRLLGAPGVARVAVFGGDIEQYQIQLIPGRLAAYKLSIEDVIAAAQNATGVRGAGFIDTGNQRILVQTHGQAFSPEMLGDAILRGTSGASVRLRDVAHVVRAPAPPIGGALINGRPGVILEVSSQYGQNTLAVTDGVEKLLNGMQPAISAAGMNLTPALFRPADFISAAVSNLGRSLVLGGLLVSVVLFLFLFNARIAFISLTAIPLSLLIAVIVLYYTGGSLNTLTLGGLAIAIGEVVDDAIIDVENIHRRLRERATDENAKPSVLQVIRAASLEVRSAVVYATFIVVCVFLPVVALSGVQGRLFRPLAFTYIVAILASLLVALTLTPALSILLLPKAIREEKEPRGVTWLKNKYMRVLTTANDHRPLALISATALFLLAGVTVPFFGGGFLPELHEGHLIAHTVFLPGTSLAESERMGARISDALLKIPSVASVAQQIGRAELTDDTEGTEYSEFHIKLRPNADQENAESEIRKTFGGFPGFSFSMNSFLAERMEEILAGSTGQVVIKVFGDNLDTLDQKADEIAAALGGVRGAADVQLQFPPGTPEISIQLRPDRLAEFGFRPADVLKDVQAAYQGVIASQVYQGIRVVDVVAILGPKARTNPDSVGSLLIESPAGVRVPLDQIAAVSLTSGRSVIAHDGTTRVQVITCNVRGRDLTSFVADARKTIEGHIRFPAGTYALFSGESEARSAAQQELLLYSFAGLIGIVLLLYMALGNVRNLGLALANLPFALVGGVLAAFITGRYITVGSLVGFVTLFGITTRNSIMMISHFEHLVVQEGMEWGRAAAFRGASERLIPILMTALVTGLGLLPLALGSGAPGREIEGPMAIVILGGLLTSTALNLLLLPMLCLRYGRFEKDQASEAF
jgi:CzcA family heavy metal efflux pump